MRDAWITLDADNGIAELTRLSGWVRELAELWSLPERAVYALDLCLQEAVDNVMRHASGPAGATSIAVAMAHRGDAVHAVVEDGCAPFDPTGHASPGLPDSLEAVEPGGQGIVLLRQFMDELRYEHRDGRNRLEMVHRLPVDRSLAG